MSETLKPCPFCGGEATIEVKTQWYDYDGGDRWWIYQADVMCDSCDAMMHVNHYKPKEFTDWATAEQFAIEAWNTRHKSAFVTGTTVATDGEPVTYMPTRTCHIVKTWSDSDYVDDWRYRCSECRCFIPVNERDTETGDVISAANYCPNCGAKVVIA